MRAAAFVLAQISDEARWAHAIAVWTLVAAVLAVGAVGTTFVAAVDEVGQFEVGEADAIAVPEPVHVERVRGGDGRVAVAGESL